VPSASVALVTFVEDSWAPLSRRARILVLMDESGSMGDPLPGSRLSKIQLAKQALAAVVQQVAPDSETGLWTFTSSPRQDYVVRVPLGRVTGQVHGQPRRAALIAAVDAMQAIPTGGTGLYDTTLAAFNDASGNYTFGRLNAILVFTDGRDEDDPGGISLATLLSAIKHEFNGGQPVRILTFAYGKDADTRTLQEISGVTGGVGYAAVRPDQVGPLLARALAQL